MIPLMPGPFDSIHIAYLLPAYIAVGSPPATTATTTPTTTCTTFFCCTRPLLALLPIHFTRLPRSGLPSTSTLRVLPRAVVALHLPPPLPPHYSLPPSPPYPTTPAADICPPLTVGWLRYLYVVLPSATVSYVFATFLIFCLNSRLLPATFVSPLIYFVHILAWLLLRRSPFAIDAAARSRLRVGSGPVVHTFRSRHAVCFGGRPGRYATTRTVTPPASSLFAAALTLTFYSG